MREIKALLVIAFVSLFLAACVNEETPSVSLATVTRAGSSPTTIKSTATRARAAITPTRAANTPTRLPPTETVVPPSATATSAPATAKAASTQPGATAEPLPPLDALQDPTVAGWNAFVASIAAIGDVGLEQTQADLFWQEVSSKRRVPLVLNDAVVFLYKGAAQSVHWQGDFSYWDSGAGLDGEQVGQTDLWYAVARFPRDSRTDYEIVVNGERGMPDPANPRIRWSTRGTNSVLTMPNFQVTDFTRKREDVAEGVLTDWISLESKAWGAPIRYRVYTPADYGALENLPVLYVTDGNDFSDTRQGAMPIVMDNLIADGKMTPVIAVFIDARNAANPNQNERNDQFLSRPEDFAEFIVDELAPTIDAAYRTDATPQGRALAGVSFGGAFTTFAGLKYPDVFGKLTIFSPAYWVYGNPNGSGTPSTGAARMNAFVQSKLNDAAFKTNQKIFISGGIPGWDVGDLKPWAARFQRTGAETQLFTSQEGHSWGAWAGLTDEMVEYLFPAPTP